MWSRTFLRQGAYEYLLRKFRPENQGGPPGIFPRPKEVGWLMAKLMVLKQGGGKSMTASPAPGGLLVKSAGLNCCAARERRKIKNRLSSEARELPAPALRIARMNMVVPTWKGEVVRGNTATNPKFLEAGEQSHLILWSKPMWNQDNIDRTSMKTIRMIGFPPLRRLCAGLQRRLGMGTAYTRLAKNQGRAAIVLDTKRRRLRQRHSGRQ